jgi:RNA polymerase sigma-70 factor (ECF subfamily)
MHDGFIRIFENIRQYEGRGSFEGWLKRIFINIVLDNIRKSAFKAPIDVNELENTADEEEIVQEVSMQMVINAIQKLPEAMRTIFNMFNFDGFSMDEIAEKLKMTSSAVRSQHSRAKQKIREIIRN